MPATTYFVDLVGGNNSNDGLSFANRKLNISAVTAAIGGDRIKVMGSPAPTDMSQTASWTDTSRTVTLTTAVTANIDLCNTAWTGDTSTTCIASTTRKEGTNSASMQVTVSQSSGTLLAHHTISSIDLSGYQQISFWIRANAAVSANLFKIRLSTATNGTSATHEFIIDRALNANQWTCLTYDNGSNMNSAIQAVALVANGTTGTPTLLLDNILACKDHTSSDSLTLQSLVGKNTGNETWWALKSINGTSLTLDAGVNSAQGAGQGYSGTTDSAAEIWKRETVKTARVTTSTTVVDKYAGTSGSVGTEVNIEGGWDTTNMSTQNLETWMDGLDGFGKALDSNSLASVQVNKMRMVRYNTGLNISTGGNNWILTDLVCNDNGTGVSVGTVTGTALTSTFTSITCAANSTVGFTTVTADTLTIPITTGYFLSNTGSGLVGTSGATQYQSIYVLGTVVANNNSVSGFSVSSGMNFILSGTGSMQCNNNGSHGVNIDTIVRPTIVNNLTCQNNGGAGLFITSPVAGVIPSLFFNSYTSSGNSTSGIKLDTTNVAASGGQIYLVNANMTDTTPVGTFVKGGNIRIYSHKEGGTTDNHKIYSDGAPTGQVLIASETGANRHTASGMAWKLTPGSVLRDTYYPASLSVCKIAVLSGQILTVNAWIKRSSTSGFTARLKIYGGPLSGVSSDVVTNATGSANTYQQETISCTPLETGVVEVYFESFGGTTNSAFIDDITFSVA